MLKDGIGVVKESTNAEQNNNLKNIIKGLFIV